MTDREKLQATLKECPFDNIVSIMQWYLNRNNISFNALRDLDKLINHFMNDRLDEVERTLFVANEKAGYLKKYLDGSMWKDEELAKLYIQPQIENAQAILDTVKEVE